MAPTSEPTTTRASGRTYFDAPFVALAHRGGFVRGVTDGAENTLEAFRAAVDLGYRYCETDVHATRDGHLVAFHDDVLDRVSDARGAIAELDFATVRAAHVGTSGQVPTLDELLEEFPRTRFNIDIKAPGAVDLLADTLARHHAEDRVCVGSFDDARLRRFRDLTRGRVATSIGPMGTAWAALVPVLPAHLTSPGYAYQVPVSQRVRGVEVPIVTPRFVDAAHRAGRQVHVWTINEPAEMHRLLDLGVDGLVSDDIVALRDLLMARGLWS